MTAPLLKVVGNKILTDAGKRWFGAGMNLSAMEYSAINTGSGDDWFGHTPNWAALAKQWPGMSAVRIPQNAASFLGLTVASVAGSVSPIQAAVATWGPTRSADPRGTYKTSQKTAFDGAMAQGYNVFVDLHWCAPQLTCSGVTNYLAPMGQSYFVDRSTGGPYWKAQAAKIVADYGQQGSRAFILELFNEPFLENYEKPPMSLTNGTSVPAGGNIEAIMLQGGFNNAAQNYGNGAAFEIDTPVALIGYQELVTIIRATGFAGIIGVAGGFWAENMSTYKNYLPTDTVAPAGWSGTWTPQLAIVMHPYNTGSYPYADGDVYGKCGTDPLAKAKTATWGNGVLAVLAAGIPVVFTEDGGFYGPSVASEPHVSYMSQWAVTNGISAYIGWEGSELQPKTGSGTYQLCTFETPYLPTTGYGAVLNAFIKSQGTGGSVSTTQNGVCAISYAPVAGFPSTAVVDHINVTITGSAAANTTPQSQNVTPGSASVTFTNLTPDTYKYSVQGMPASGAGFGTPVTGSMSITSTAATTISLNLPSAVTWTQP